MRATPASLFQLTRLVLILSGLVTAGFVVYAAQPWQWELGTWFGVLGFALWALGPYFALAALNRRARNHAPVSWLLLIYSTVAGSTAVALMYMAFVVDPDPQGGLLFIFLPLCQWLGVGVVALVVRLWGRRSSEALTRV